MTVEELLEQVDIVDLISNYVELTDKNGELWGLSPFKDEKTPSFSVRAETGKFYDFSSGIGGTAITFLEHYYHISKHEAIEKLKKMVGLTDNIQTAKQHLLATTVCKKYAKKTTTKKPPAETILPDDYMQRYEKRKDKLAVWENEGISMASMDKFEVYYDGFSNRLVYPIRNIDGKIVNVGGRALDPDWKDKGLRKYTYFFSWGQLNTIYGLSENMGYIKEKNEIILFEGCKSVLIADTWGIHNCGALLTSHLSPAQMKILAQLGCRVVFALDKEINITEDHNIRKLKQYVNIEYLYDRNNLLSDKDAPVDKGKEVFDALYEFRVKYR